MRELASKGLSSTAVERRHPLIATWRAPPSCLHPAGALEAEGIPFTPAVSGMFVWVDLR